MAPINDRQEVVRRIAVECFYVAGRSALVEVGLVEAPEQIATEEFAQLVVFGAHRSTPISSNAVRSARTA